MTKTICLNMIVKDEAHIIKETLEKLCNKINFNYYVICDTGSSDDTINIIKTFFEKKGIKGELYHDTWKDFAHNRTLALNKAFNKSDYLFVFDADDEIEGNLILPELEKDSYQFIFGGNKQQSYDRTLLINNRKKWKYIGVLHEILNCLEKECSTEMIMGDYHVISGREGSRNKDPNKYYKDAIILEKAFIEAIVDKEQFLTLRYAFYCANSFYDAMHYEKAIEWYKIYLKIGIWNQEKYMSCLNIYLSYEKLGQKENGFFYLIEGLSQDPERMECLFYLIIHYCNKDQPQIAYNFYNIVKDFYEDKYTSFDFSKKLFFDKSRGDLFLPYYMIITSLHLKKIETTIKMYEIIFKQQYPYFNEELIKNLLHNFQFILENIRPENKYIFKLFENYIAFLKKNNFPLEKYMDYITTYRIHYKNDANKPNLLFFTGFMDKLWNYTYAMNNALGGSETAVALLSAQLSKDYNVYVAGDVAEESINDVHYIHNNNLQYLINGLNFKVVIVSRYLIFFELFPNVKTEQVYIWAHDTELVSNSKDLTDSQLIQKWNHKINGCVCLTNWHRDLFEKKYPELCNKLFVINNGINKDMFGLIETKIKNQFIYTSRSERGLGRLLALWEGISRKVQDASLVIASYTDFPANENDKKIEEMIAKYSNVRHLGKLNKKDLYTLMAKSEYWFYPNTYPETSCITAMEMIMSEVICIYYPLAGLVDTIGDYGLAIDPSKINEIDFVYSLVQDENKEIRANMKKNGKVYGETCSWKNRSLEWNKLIANSVKNRLLYLSKTDTLPQQHIDYLVKMKADGIEPKVVYDLGACVGTWSKTAKQIWPNTQYILFDGLEDAEFLYQEYQHNIGILSDKDGKKVTWYQNDFMPYGNSYYKENNDQVFPENCGKTKLTETLDSVVMRKGFPLPDFLKIDVQGSELNVLVGAREVIKSVKHLIIEMQHIDYNRGAPKCQEVIPYIESLGFKLVTARFHDNGPDADYHFTR
jgi:FkbM family methyltransferase